MSSSRSDNDKQDPLSAEIDASLDGVNLQELDLGSAPKTSGGRIKRTDHSLMRGKIAGVTGDDVFVEIGPRMQGVISVREFETPPKIGETFDFNLHGKEDDLWVLSRKDAKTLAAWDEVVPGSLVKAKVTGQNTGGLELKVGPLAAFMPFSQISLQREENVAQYVGQMLTCEVLELDKEKKRILLSRRKVLEKERDSVRQETVGKLSVGQTVKGKVTRVETFGAFVDLGGGIEGLIHVSNLSRRRVESAGEVVASGDQVEVAVISITEGGKRIGLSKKMLEPDPWLSVKQRYSPDQIVNGKVTRLTEFGAFVELEAGLEGLVHVSQLGKERVRRAIDVCKPGETLAVRIVSIEPDRSRISLSRLDPRGALIGSEDSVESSVIDEALQQATPKPIGTNLGSLFKKAFDKKP